MFTFVNELQTNCKHKTGTIVIDKYQKISL